MSVSVQSPMGLDPFGQSAFQGLQGLQGLEGLQGLQGAQGLSSQSPQSAAEIQARLTEAIMQILNLLINEIMKALQQAQQAAQAQSGGQSPSNGGGGGGGGGGGPGGVGGPQGASNAYKPSLDGQGSPNGGPVGGPAGAPPPSFASQSPTPQVGDVSGVSGGKAPAGMPADLWQGCQDAGKKTGVDPYLLAAQMEKESQFGKGLSGSPSAGDGLMQVEPSTRQAYAGKFQDKMGHAYDHNNPKDQIAMAGVILADKGGDATNMLQKYNGGDNWTPGTTDSYGREIKAAEYAASVQARAQEMKAGG